MLISILQGLRARCLLLALLVFGSAHAAPALPSPTLAADAVRDAMTGVTPSSTRSTEAAAAQLRAATVAQSAAERSPVVSEPVAQAAPLRTGRTAIVRATAYNSTPGQTDSTPFITATGTRTRPGVVALSRDLLRLFPYGTRIMLEDLSGRYNFKGRVFIVEDTMAARKTNSLDIWMGTRSEAIAFGARSLRITALR